MNYAVGSLVHYGRRKMQVNIQTFLRVDQDVNQIFSYTLQSSLKKKPLNMTGRDGSKTTSVAFFAVFECLFLFTLF